MWTVHLLSRPQSGERQAGLSAAFDQLASRFPTLEWVFDAYGASAVGERPATPWTGWFLEELPDEEAHFVGTEHELRFAMLLLCVRLVDEAPTELRPREWFAWSYNDIRTGLDR